MIETRPAPVSITLPAPPRSASVALLCTRCSATLAPLSSGASSAATSFPCPRCNAVTVCDRGVWRCLSPEDARYYDRFISEYESIRASEGRGSEDPAYYLALPFEDLSGRLTEQWSIRARTFTFLHRHLLSALAARRPRPLRILDLGAGNGWLSYRLSLLGHHPVAVDLLTNRHDGLGAASHFSSILPALFPRVQATLDRLPFAPATFDLAIFNASFHYSENYDRTLAEAMRCIRPGGAVVIADTPWYPREETGRRMVEEKHIHLRTTYGFASDSLHSLEFLTPDRLHTLAANLGLRWQVLKPFYGLRWTLRPLRAALMRRRQPSQFHIYVATGNA